MYLVRYRNALQDEAGNGVSGATVTVTINGSGAAAALFSNATGTSPIVGNAVLTSSSPAGTYEFYAAVGVYDMAITKGGVTLTLDAAVVLSGASETFKTPENYGADMTGVGNSAAAFALGFAANPTLHGCPQSLLKLRDVVLGGSNKTFMGDNSRVSAATSATNLFRLQGYFTTVKDLYVADNTASSSQALRLEEGRAQRVIDVHMVNAGAGAVRLAPITGSCAVPYIQNLVAEGLTGVGFDMSSSVNDGQFSNTYMSGMVDFDSNGLGLPRNGSVGYRQNTPVVGSLAVGGHQYTAPTAIGLTEGYHFTDVQYTSVIGLIADSCTSYGVIADGSTTQLHLAHSFVGTSLGLRFSGTVQQVFLDGLRTKLNGVIPPWGQSTFYGSPGTIYDLTVQNTATVKVAGDLWHGDKRVFVASTANLDVTGGQWMRFYSGGVVAASTTTFLKRDGVTSTEDDAQFLVDRKGWLFIAKAKASVAPGASLSFTYNVRKNKGSTPIHSVVVSNSNTFNKSWAYVVAVDEGDLVSVQLVAPTSVASARHWCDLQLLGD